MSTNNEQSNVAIAAVEEAMQKAAEAKSFKTEGDSKVDPKAATNKTLKRSASQS